MKLYTKVVNQIYETNDLDKFRIMKGNRDFEVRQSLVDDLKEFGRFEYPIMVNEFFDVIDGQNRLAAAKFLKVPIQFFINDGARKDTVIRINSDSVNWTLVDYIKSFASEGLHDYVLLLNNLNDPRASCLTASTVISISSVDFDSYNSKYIKSGRYSIGRQGKTSEFLSFIKELSLETGIKKFKDRAGKSIYRVWNLENVDKHRLFNVLKRPSIIEILDVTLDMSYLIAKIISEYNKHLSDGNKIAFYYNEDKNIILSGEE